MAWHWTQMVSSLILSSKYDIQKLMDGFSGTRLAICTAAPDDVHFLRIYDVHRKNGQHAIHEVQLDPFLASIPPSTLEEGEVTAVSFSPDGLLLAIARSDDELHVYDSRFMGQGRKPMRRFRHWGDDCCVGGLKWGVVDAVWVDGWCGRGVGIVTGGSDGEFFIACCPLYLTSLLVLRKRLRSFLGCPQIGR
jgi:WD40 repeat protein